MALVRSVRWNNQLTFLGERPTGRNYIDVVVGANGTGKTALLCAIASRFSTGEGQVDVRGGVSRVISQTFSPFSRFPSSAHGRRGVLSIYRDEEDSAGFYIPLGLTRDKIIRPKSLAQGVVERAILGVSQSSDRARRFFQFLQEAGFLSRCQVVFKKRMLSWDWLEHFRRDPEGAMSALMSQDRNSKFRSTILREIDIEGWAPFKDAMQTVLSVIGDHAFWASELMVDFGSESQGDSLAYARLQAFSVLKALGLATLGDVRVFRPSGTPLAVSHASSGEQQLLCSLLGLAGSLRNDSIVLIDEPELSLHPKWQIEFSKNILLLLKHVSGCHLIIATHSPLVVQGFQYAGCDPVRMDEDWMLQNKPWRSRVPVEEILVDTFKSPVPSSLYLADELIRIINMDSGSSLSKMDAQRRLAQLRSIYSGRSAEVKIIDKAHALLGMGDV